ncbi:MAG: hypothetical protein ABJF23_32210, partial [Bryobacteraceae bacterium]
TSHPFYPYVTKAMDLSVIRAGCLAQPTSTYCIDTSILRGPAAFFIAGGGMGLVGSSKGISPTLTEINLSAVPIALYYSLNGSGSTPIVDGCPTTITVRQCFQQLLSTGTNNWRGQGVTGVRFFFTLAGGYYSTPFDSAGNVQTAWTQNLYQFFADLRSYGIQRVTPTPVFDTWSGPPSMLQTRTMNTCFDMYGVPTKTLTLSFVPWLPYGLDPLDSYYPDRTCGNGTYRDGAQTPSDIFWGWSRFVNLMNTVMAQAHTATLIINALDYYQESNMQFTVEGRMIYDNYRSVDVLQSLRDRMTANGFDSGRVAPSANGPPKPSPASGHCGSWYGDSALVLNLSELVGAIAGPLSKFGAPPGHPDMGGELSCYNPNYPNNDADTSGTMPSLPVWHSPPTFIDMHSQKTYLGLNDTGDFAKTFYSDIWAFLVARGLSGNYVVFGETNPVSRPGCDEYTVQQADAAMNGVQGSINGYKNSLLYANHASSVVMRPWQRTEYGYTCTPNPNMINPPFNSFLP